MNELKLNDKFCNIKSDYFLQKIFGIVKKNKSLGIIKYNKMLQKRLKIDINSYKDYSQFFSSIEIEIKPIYNFLFKSKFINMPDEDKEYYHIYFDDKKKENKRNYIKKEEKVNNIKIIIDYQVKSFQELFSCCKSIESINFTKFYRINITK